MTILAAILMTWIIGNLLLFACLGLAGSVRLSRKVWENWLDVIEGRV